MTDKVKFYFELIIVSIIIVGFIDAAGALQRRGVGKEKCKKLYFAGGK